MTSWQMLDAQQIDSPVRGFAVRDADGLSIGRIHGCVVDANGRVQMLAVRVDTAATTDHYIIPIGAVGRIDDSTSSIHLREVHGASIGKRGLRLDGELPEHRLMTSLQRFFPPPSEAVVRRLAIAMGEPMRDGLRWTSLDEIS